MRVEIDHRERDTVSTDALKGSFFGIASSLITLVLGFVRSVLLARWVAPEHFGVVALVLFYISLAGHLRTLDLGKAFMHRQDDSERLVGTFFCLQTGTLLLSLALLVIATPLLRVAYPTTPLLTSILLALVGVELVKGLSGVQETLLGKGLAFRALAITDVVASITMLLVAPYLAWRGWGAWALVAEQASGILARFVMTWLVFRPWRPRIAWDREIARWFLDFGRAAWGAANLGFLIDRFDDVWIGTMLGEAPLGYYSRAYEFAHYPRRVIANPLVSVFTPVFARLQVDRRRLSQAFYRVSHVILRTGFLISGAFALVMPEFIALVIGTQWQPMLLTFRLMLIYTLLDALLMLSGSLLLVVGDPRGLQRSRLVQALFFIPAVIAGAYLWGINGVALAADGMLVIGAATLYPSLRKVVDFSLFKLAFWPLMALGGAYGAGLLVEARWALPSLWLSAAAKLALFTAVYAGALAFIERGDYLRGIRWIWARARVAAP
jgi:O-antigen/teichoic acid export membrane protein